MSKSILLCLDGLSDTGNRRKNNEDSWWAGQLGGESACQEPSSSPLAINLQESPALLIVSDGVGGANAGEVASKMTVTTISSALAEKVADLRLPDGIIALLEEVLKSTNQAIATKSAESGFEGMGATLSLVMLANDGKAYWAQAGDSRIYLCRKGKLRQISRDHSPVGRMRQKGLITETEARVHPLRNQIDQSLGDPNNEFIPEFGVESILERDVFLLCSDGLSDGLWDREIEQQLAQVHSPKDVRATTGKLIEKAKAASGRDNITAVVAIVASGPKPATVLSRTFHKIGHLLSPKGGAPVPSSEPQRNG